MRAQLAALLLVLACAGAGAAPLGKDARRPIRAQEKAEIAALQERESAELDAAPDKKSKAQVRRRYKHLRRRARAKARALREGRAAPPDEEADPR